MGRKQKHPNHAAESQRLMNELLDEVVDLWTSEESPELKTIAEEVEMSPSKLRKLLITAGERDHTTYYTSTTADHILSLYHGGATLRDIMEKTGLSYTSVQGYLPHRTVYGLDTLSSEAERIKKYRRRKKAVSDLHTHLSLPDQSLYLWKTIICFEGFRFTTSGRGNREGVKFTYEVSKPTTGGGRHYKGESVEGYGNEMWITTLPDKVRKEKSISRSTVDLALKNALQVQAEEGCVSGPRKLGVPGCRSQLYSLFIRFGVIKTAHSDEE